MTESLLPQRDFNDARLMYLYMSERLGTMRAAAEALDVAPSSVSRQIAQLEQSLHLPVVEKGTHTIRLTEAGKLAVDYYRARLVEKEELLSKLDDLLGVKTGNYTLAVGEGFISTMLLSTLQHFNENHPNVHLDIVTASSTHEVIDMVAEDLAHIGFIFDAPSDSRLRIKFTIPQPIRAVVSPNHSLARRTKVSLSDLASYPLVLPRLTFRIREILSEAEKAEGVILTPAYTTDSILLMRELARAGTAVALLSEISIVSQLKRGVLVAIDIDNDLFHATNVNVITRLGRHLPRGANAILQEFARVMKEVAPENRTAP